MTRHHLNFIFGFLKSLLCFDLEKNMLCHHPSWKPIRFVFLCFWNICVLCLAETLSCLFQTWDHIAREQRFVFKPELVITVDALVKDIFERKDEKSSCGEETDKRRTRRDWKKRWDFKHVKTMFSHSTSLGRLATVNTSSLSSTLYSSRCLS